MEKTFLLGVGCQKGGTSWMHAYLRRHPEARFDFGKEYHVLDALYVPAMARFLTDARREVSRLEDSQTARAQADRSTDRTLALLKARIAFCDSPPAYLDHFASMANSEPRVRVVGDITPSYATLPQDAYRWVVQGMADRGLRTRVLFIMRDPVERIISSLRTKLPRSSGDNTPPSSPGALNWQTPDIEVRTRYEATLRSLDAVFDANDVLVLFYEELFRDAAIQRLCSHLGISGFPANFERVVNGGSPDLDIDTDMRRKIAQAYSGTYAFVADRYGTERMQSLWKGYALLG